MSYQTRPWWGPQAFYAAPDKHPGSLLFEVGPHGILIPRRAAMVSFEEDFMSLRIGAANVSGWHVDSSGTATSALTLTDAANGVAAFQPGGTATNNSHYAWAVNTTVHECIRFAAGKRFWMEASFKVEDADQDLPLIGAHITQDDPWATEPSDQALFRALGGAGALEFAIGKTNATEVTISLGTLEDDTFVRLLAVYDGVDTVHAFRFNTSWELVTSGSASVTSSTTGDLLPDTEMAPAFGMEAEDTGTDFMSVDYLNIHYER